MYCIRGGISFLSKKTHRHLLRELFAQLASVLLLGLERVEERQTNDVGPDSRARRAADATDQLQLQQLAVRLEDRLLGEELAQNASAA